MTMIQFDASDNVVAINGARNLKWDAMAMGVVDRSPIIPANSSQNDSGRSCITNENKTMEFI